MKWLRIILFTVAAVAAAHAALACEPMSVRTQPVGGTYCHNQQVTLYFGVDTNDFVTYRWYRNGKLLFGETANTLVLQGTEADEGTYYARASTDCDVLTSSSVEVALGIRLYPANSINNLNGATHGSIGVSHTGFSSCPYPVQSSVPWITITGVSVNNSVSYAIAANTSGVPRAGSITVGGRTFHVTQGVAASDFNADGRPDLVWRNYSTGESSAWLMNGTTFLQKCPLPSKAVNWSIEATGDFDHDTYPDLVWRNTSSGAVRLATMAGNVAKAEYTLPYLPTSSRIEGTGDFDFDGNIDLVIRNYASGENSVWHMRGVKYWTTSALPSEPNLSKFIDAVADMDANFTPDLVFRNHSTGDGEIWTMSRMERTAVTPLPWAGWWWNLEMAVDLNGDRVGDFVWRNYENGDDSVWFMSPWGLQSYGSVPPENDLNQHLGGRGPVDR